MPLPTEAKDGCSGLVGDACAAQQCDGVVDCGRLDAFGAFCHERFVGLPSVPDREPVVFGFEESLSIGETGRFGDLLRVLLRNMSWVSSLHTPSRSSWTDLSTHVPTRQSAQPRPGRLLCTPLHVGVL